MYEGEKMRKVLMFILFLSYSFAVPSLTLSRTFSHFRGDEYNLLIAPPYISKGGKRTKQAIMEGFFDAVDEVRGIIKRNDINALLKEFPAPDTPDDKVANISPSYTKFFDVDKKMYDELKDLIHTLSENDRKVSRIIAQQENSVNDNNNSNSLDTGDDMDDFEDISEESIASSDKQISTEDVFINKIRKLTKEYFPDKDVHSINLSELPHPFIVGNTYKKKHISGLFGIAFYPQKRGSLKVLGMDILLIHINTELDNRATVIIRNIKPFAWHRNPALIAGRINATLKQIISQALGINISR